MIDRRQFVVISASAAASAVPLRAAPADKASRQAEVRALREFAEQTHPRGREAREDQGWRQRWKALETSADRLSDGAYFIGLRRGLGWFGDGHTTVLPFEFTGGIPRPLRSGPFTLSLPLQVRLFHDGAFITAASPPLSNITGQRLERIGSLSSVDLIRAHAQDWPGNPAWAHRWAASAFRSPALLQGFGALADPRSAVTLVAGGNSASVASISEESNELIAIERKLTDREHWAKAAGGGNYVRPVPGRGAVYISIDDMDDVDGKTFEQLTRDAFAAMDRPEIERVVVDLRRNGGGNNYWGEPLRKGLEASRFNRPGKLYVLISPTTFSAAQNLANRLERETFATFVGEPTGGSPNHFGDAKQFEGKATGISAIVSTIPWFDSYPQDRRQWIMPDLPVPQLFSDWRSGRDRALEVALAHRTADISDFLSRDRVFFFSRATQKDEWKPFWA